MTVRACTAAPRTVADAVTAVIAPYAARSEDEVRTAVHEVVANAVLHGGGPIAVRALRHATEVTLTVSDPGAATAARPRRPVDEAGRGHTLIAASCDGVRGAPTTTGGRAVTLRFVTAGPGGPVSPREP